MNAPTPYRLLAVGDARDAHSILTGAGAPPVRCAYLDPPYNTGQDFGAYRDAMSRQAWLAMLQGTFEAVHPLIRADGSIWVHVDSSADHLVRLALDETFGPANHVGTIIWQRKERAAFMHSQLATVTDRIIVYARDRAQMPPLVYGATEAGRRVPVHHNGNAPGVLSFPAGSVDLPGGDRIIPAGAHNTRAVISDLLDDVQVAGGVNANRFRMTGSFRWGQASIEGMAEQAALDGRAAFIAPRSPLRPSYVGTVTKGKPVRDLWSFHLDGAPTNEEARGEQEEMFGPGRSFPTPKPVRLLERIIGCATDPGDLVLDPFAGSGTTLVAAGRLGRGFAGIELHESTVASWTLPRLAAAGLDAGLQLVGAGSDREIVADVA